jgi:hypothetical protein
MKRPLLLLFCVLAAGFVLGSVGCERHPLEQTKERQQESGQDKDSGH